MLPDSMQNIFDAVSLMSDEDKQELLAFVRSSCKPKPKLYECKVVFGTGSRRSVQWVKYAEWSTGHDSIWIEFSHERCMISEDLAKVVPDLLACAKGRRYLSFEVFCTLVDDALAPSEEVSGDG